MESMLLRLLDAIVSIPEPRPEAENGSQETSLSDESYVFAVNWQLGFCETKPDKSECITQTEQRFDAIHFSLHGLCVAQGCVLRSRSSRQTERYPRVMGAVTSSKSKRRVTQPHRREDARHKVVFSSA